MIFPSPRLPQTVRRRTQPTRAAQSLPRRQRCGMPSAMQRAASAATPASMPPMVAPAMPLLALATLLLALLPAAPVAAQSSSNLGRLFFTPAERAALDGKRGGGPAVAGAPGMTDAQAAAAAAAAAAAPPPAPPEPVELNGLIRGSSGRSTAWLNLVPQQDAANQLAAPQALSLRLSSGRWVVMKPGQQYNPANGTVQEAGR